MTKKMWSTKAAQYYHERTWKASITRSFIMVNTMIESENTSFANISISFLRSCSDHVHECCEHDLRKGIKILAKLVISSSIIAFNLMKLLVILFTMKLIAQINIFKYEKRFYCRKWYQNSRYQLNAFIQGNETWIKRKDNESFPIPMGCVITFHMNAV